ncbi:MAG: hypothetical protein HY658_08835 [Actinobacteria bacterium]|nr:hypothetical protein [Actinomycetota bacterium]
MSTRPGLHDPEGWIDRWRRLHGSDLIAGAVASLALDRLEGPVLDDAIGIETIFFSDLDREFEVEVRYLVEQLPGGRVFHVISILSPGDPLPPEVHDDEGA